MTIKVMYYATEYSTACQWIANHLFIFQCSLIFQKVNKALNAFGTKIHHLQMKETNRTISKIQMIPKVTSNNYS